MRYSFSGHESFICKSLWLKKGYDFILEGNSFSSPESVVKLGVGKNMVASIRYWMKAFGLTQNDELTNIAQYLLSNEGKDCFLEDDGSLWLLHYMLVKNGIASLYNLVFLSMQRELKQFDQEQVLSFVKRKCSVPEQKNTYNENTVKKDIRVLLQNYVMPTDKKSVEDFTGLLLNLRLIRRTDGGYAFNDTTIDSIPQEIVLFALNDYRGEDLTLSFDRLHELALIFALPIDRLIEIIQTLENNYEGILHYSDNSGVRNVQFLSVPESSALLNLYYDKK